MLKVVNYFRDLDASERRSCLYQVFCAVMDHMFKLKNVSELCLIVTDLLSEILENWEQGTRT